jgi:hypothetical protein
MPTHRSRIIWKWLSLFFAGGMLLQATTTATTCNQIAASVTAGLSTSIVNQIIGTLVNDSLGLGTGGGLLSGIGT